MNEDEIDHATLALTPARFSFVAQAALSATLLLSRRSASDNGAER